MAAGSRVPLSQYAASVGRKNARLGVRVLRRSERTAPRGLASDAVTQLGYTPRGRPSRLPLLLSTSAWAISPSRRRRADPGNAADGPAILPTLSSREGLPCQPRRFVHVDVKRDKPATPQTT